MQSLKLTILAVPAFLALSATVHAQPQVLSLAINNGAARMTVSDGTQFAYAKALAGTLRGQEINDVTLCISANGTSNGDAKCWVHVVVVDNEYEDSSQNLVIVCVSPDMPFQFVSALAEALTEVDGRRVRFISKKTFDSSLSGKAEFGTKSVVSPSVVVAIEDAR